MVSIVLPDNTLAAELPQPSIVIRAGGNKVRAISTKGTVPDPALVRAQRGFQRQRSAFLHLLQLLGARGGNFAEVGGHEAIVGVAGAGAVAPAASIVVLVLVGVSLVFAVRVAGGALGCGELAG